MNRVLISQPESPVASTEKFDINLDMIQAMDLPNCTKSIFVPLKYQQDYAYPLLVWLHDAGSSENDVRKTIPRASLRNYLAVGPQGTTLVDSESPDAGFAWQQTVEGIQQAKERVESCIQSVGRRYNFSSSNIFIAGSGSGGTMALRLAMEFPGRFAGCASLGGAFPRHDRPLRNINRVRGMEVLLACNVDNPDYETDNFCRDLHLMFAAGINTMARQYSGDGSEKQMLRDLDRWLMTIFTGQNQFEDRSSDISRTN